MRDFDLTLPCGCDVTVTCEVDREWRDGRYHGTVRAEAWRPNPHTVGLDRCPHCNATTDIDVVDDLCQQAHDRHEEARND